MKKIYLIIILLFICAGLSFGAYKINQKFGFIQSQKTANRIYKQGLNDLRNNDLQNAYFNFSKISKYNALYEAAIFHKGLIAIELNDNDSLIKNFETLLSEFPNSFFTEKAIYSLAVAYFNKGLKEQAYANFKIIVQKHENTDYADASNYFLGLLSEPDEKDKAVEYFVNYINAAPQGKYALNSIEELKKIQKNFTPEQNLIIGKSLLLNNKYSESLAFLNMARLPESWEYISVAYKKTGNVKAFKKIFEDGLLKYSKENSETQQQAVDEYVNLFADKKKGYISSKIICDKAKCKLNDYILYNLAQYVDAKTKIEYYNRIYTEFPDSNYAADSLFNSMFNDYLNGSYENAIIKAKKHMSKYSDKKSAPAAIYWLARSYDNKRNNQEANSLYNKICVKYTDSYYAYLSKSRLNRNTNPFKINNNDKITEEFVAIDFPIIHSNLPINASKKIRDLVILGDFEIFEYADFNNKILKSWVSYYNGNYAKASILSEEILNQSTDKPTFDDTIYKLIYPIAYAKEINKYNGVPPYLMLSIIKKESSFTKDAKSVTGAVGLTQLMPDTAQYIAGLSNIKFNQNSLYEPEYNIELGERYYKYLRNSYNSNDLFALTAYNAGKGNVDKWITTLGTRNLDEFVEKIPFKETKIYVKQIFRNYWVYNNIYNSSNIK